jgi:transcriptional regulator with XRE-family HTH domain
MKIGEKIKTLRKSKKMTLDELSRASGVALTTISRIENEKMVGTLDSHMAIAKALGLTLPQLYSDLETQLPNLEVQTEASKKDFFLHTDKASYEILTAPVLNKKMMPILLKIEPFGKTAIEQTKAGSEKFIFILSGKLEINVGDKKHILNAKDTLYFDASTPHFYRNIGKGQIKAICVISPPML